MDWRELRIADDGTHHVNAAGRPLSGERFDEVLKFHAPGLAPVRRGDEAWHIDAHGRPAYARRFLRTFGFYEGRAAVQASDGWHHVTADGGDLSAARYAWCGNFQEGRCAVRDADGRYLHIDLDGRPVTAERWRYAGDYRDGVAVVQGDDGRSTHVDRAGRLVHGRWFVDLDVFHKGFARARDERGWHHVDRAGRPAYARRFAAAEPFYNGQARVERADGGLEVVDEAGRPRVVLRGAGAPASEAPADALARDGFVLVPAVLDRATIEDLRRAVEQVIATDVSSDLLRAADGHVRKLTYPLAKHPAFLRALAHPRLLGLALALCPDPEDLVPTWEDVLLKPPFSGLAVPVHQDIALQSVRGGVFSLGVHLDDADGNPVRFFPGTHLDGPLTRDAVRRIAAIRPSVEVRPRAGDVVAHDVLVVHASDANLGACPRTTWYLEFRTRAQLRRDGPWPPDWAERRRALLFHAAAAREAAGLDVVWPPCAPGETREAWLARPCETRVPHVGESIEFDLSSPYDHFA